MMTDRIASLWPEIVLFITLSIVILLGLSPEAHWRRLTHWITALGLAVAFLLSLSAPEVTGLPAPALAQFVKPAACVMGLLLLLGLGAIDDHLERRLAQGLKFDPLLTTRGEMLAFFLLSLIGLMLCTSATDLIWLFLALELTSLPTYIMIAGSRKKNIGHEAAVKYFFLGALSAAIFLYGFALLYGATGSLHLADIRDALVAQYDETGSVSVLGLMGVLLSVVGISFKIAAVPMHFYTADVYEGAATPVSAFLAFVPKTAGFVSIMLIGGTIVGLGKNGQTWPEAFRVLVWVIAVMTMTVGNTLALLQTSVKRILAYSSIAHSGYVLIGIVAGPALLTSTSGIDVVADDRSLTSNGFGAVVFYLLAYGVMNLGAFLVLACLHDPERNQDLESLDDLSGLSRRHPWLAGAMAICSMSLLGLPPLIGFFGKLYLFSAGVSAGEIALVVIAGLNSAISAWYYLKLAGLPWLGQPSAVTDRLVPTPFLGRPAAAFLSAVGVLVLMVAGAPIMRAGSNATVFNWGSERAATASQTASHRTEAELAAAHAEGQIGSGISEGTDQ